jgi:hypothetical protein
MNRIRKYAKYIVPVLLVMGIAAFFGLKSNFKEESNKMVICSEKRMTVHKPKIEKGMVHLCGNFWKKEDGTIICYEN